MFFFVYSVNGTERRVQYTKLHIYIYIYIIYWEYNVTGEYKRFSLLLTIQ